MTLPRSPSLSRAREAVARAREARGGFRTSTAGNVAIFLMTLAMIVLVPDPRIIWASALCIALTVAVYPLRTRRLLRLRWLVLLVLLASAPLLLMGPPQLRVLGLSLSAAGAQAALRVSLRLIVVLVAVEGFTHSVDIASLAGVFERASLKGMGFAMGVALNLLPALQTSSSSAWYALWMRGGLRRQPLRALRYLLVTVIGSALRRAEEIALAAEARAFSPDRSWAAPLRMGRPDWVVTTLAAAAFVALCAVP